MDGFARRTDPFSGEGAFHRGVDISAPTGTVVRDTANGILDQALPPDEQAQITGILATYGAQGVTVHAVRTRSAGQRRFVSLHLLVPGDWSIQRGHDLAEQIERDIIVALPKTTVFTHLEPVEDPRSWEDQTLDRAYGAGAEARRGGEY